jgi:oxygen-independent coproporphyrinogen-3 oxidase
MTPLEQMLQQTPYVAYTYSYPHKTAYRPLEPPLRLRDLWSDEKRDALFLYLHVPFCEARCGYCNLFTLARPAAGLPAAYLDALRRQARQVRSALGEATFARLAIGGGTPTYLDLDGLATLFDIAEEMLGRGARRIPVAIETSPGTCSADKLRLMRERGVSRVSIGVQSFVAAEVAAAGRWQAGIEVEQALKRIRAAGFPTLNIDLIYGLPGQTVESWLTSLRAALRFRPEELYLYPLYVRPLTGLGRQGVAWDDHRLACYRAGRNLLLDAGYRQVSMRMFRANHAPACDQPVYCCQEDGMVGLGSGARSYTQRCHYSSEYAIGNAGVRAIVDDYVSCPTESFGWAHYGVLLDAEEQHRRYVVKSLLRVDGLALDAYRRLFGEDALGSVPELGELLERGLAVCADGQLRLTEAGLERSDMLGPWLYSTKVHQLMKAYELR